MRDEKLYNFSHIKFVDQLVFAIQTVLVWKEVANIPETTKIDFSLI